MPSGRGYDSSLSKNCPELSQATEVSADLVKSMLCSVESMGLLGTTGRRSDAWLVMRREFNNLAKAPQVCIEDA